MNIFITETIYAQKKDTIVLYFSSRSFVSSDNCPAESWKTNKPHYDCMNSVNIYNFTSSITYSLDMKWNEMIGVLDHDCALYG